MAKESQELTMLLVGDVRNNRDDPPSVFQHVGKLLRDADFLLGKLALVPLGSRRIAVRAVHNALVICRIERAVLDCGDESLFGLLHLVVAVLHAREHLRLRHQGLIDPFKLWRDRLRQLVARCGLRVLEDCRRIWEERRVAVDIASLVRGAQRAGDAPALDPLLFDHAKEDDLCGQAPKPISANSSRKNAINAINP